MTDLTTDAERRALLASALATNDATTIVSAVSALIRAMGTSRVAREASKSRQTLYRAFHDGRNPTVETLFSTLSAMGMKLTVAI